MTIAPNATENQVTEQKTAEQNFAQIRKALEAERAARQLAEEKAATLEKEANIRKSRRVEDDDDEDASDEPYIDRKSLKKTLGKALPSLKEETIAEVRKEMRQEMALERKNAFLKQNTDFNEIMKPEMMQKFFDKHPALAEGLLSMPDDFERQKVVYENVKALGLHKKEEPKTSIQDTVDRNRRAPGYQPSGVGTAPYASGGDFSPAGQAAGFAKLTELKNRLRLG